MSASTGRKTKSAKAESTAKSASATASDTRASGRKPSPTKALLFDFGNTLAFLDYELLAREFSRPERPMTAEALEHAEYEGRAALDRCMLESTAARKPTPDEAYKEYFRAWLAAAGIPPEEMREHGARFAQIHLESTLWRVVRPGTLEVLERLKSRGFKLAIVSNADGRVEADARRFGLAPYFDAIIDSAVVGVEKPDPRIFRAALDRLGVAPGEARYTGDIYSIDMVGARAAGIEGKLIDCMARYSWVDHERIRHVGELHPLD
jgi:putative hydrolase of the HAD superfamily